MQSIYLKPAFPIIILFILIQGCCPPLAVYRSELMPQLLYEHDIKIRPLDSHWNEEDTLLFESMPFELYINIKTQLKNGRCCQNSLDQLQNIDIQLNELRYKLVDESGKFYFSDTVNLHGILGSGSIIIKPGLTVSEFSSRLGVIAELDYFSPTFNSECENEFKSMTTTLFDEKVVHPLQIGARYERIRTAYSRRHLLENGRHLSWDWLKEYEPNLDRKELLFHSRTFCATGDTVTRIYVPWIYNCSERPTQTLEDGTIIPGCGTSIHNYSESIYGSNENPLLRGGIAMATFALEASNFLADHSISQYERKKLAWNSLHHALTLLKYFEDSEWIDNNNARTGFFLRSRWPGSLYEYSKPEREYFYASIDEIIGMTLGLFHLHQALIDIENNVERVRVEQLTHRLATQLQGNHYFIMPYKRVMKQVNVTSNGTIISSGQVPTWESIGLPLERHKGWPGGIAFEWFLSRSFHKIIGLHYNSPSYPKAYWIQSIDVPFLDVLQRYADIIRDHFGLPSNLPIDLFLSLIDASTLMNFITTYADATVFFTMTKSELELFTEALQNTKQRLSSSEKLDFEELLSFFNSNLTPVERAKLCIQGIGFLSYYDGDRYPICDEIFGNDMMCATFMSSSYILFQQLFGNEDLTLEDFLIGPEISSKQWNFPMLLHAFQIADPIGNQSDVVSIRSEMAKLLRGVLGQGGIRTNMKIDDAIRDERIPLLDIPDNLSVLIGIPGRDNDYYAAAVARTFNLSSDLSRTEDKVALENGIQQTLEYIESNYNTSAPVGAPKTCTNDPLLFCSKDSPCDDNGECKPWPQLYLSSNSRQIGQAFCWEKKSNNRFQDASYGPIPRDEITKLYNRGLSARSNRYAAVVEGAGLGYMLPYMMLDEEINSYSSKYLHKQLPVCFTNPVQTARSPIPSSERCYFRFETYPSDIFDNNVRNDSYKKATQIGFGTHTSLTIDKASSLDYYNNYVHFISDDGYAIYVPPESDDDFYILLNPQKKDIMLTFKYVRYQGQMQKYIYLDGNKLVQDYAPCDGQDPCLQESTYSANGKERHMILVTGGIGLYELNIKPVID